MNQSTHHTLAQSTFIRQILWWHEKIQIKLGLKQILTPDKINNPPQGFIKARTVYPPNWEARQKMNLKEKCDYFNSWAQKL
jgi:hypothetical protein